MTFVWNIFWTHLELISLKIPSQPVCVCTWLVRKMMIRLMSFKYFCVFFLFSLTRLIFKMFCFHRWQLLSNEIGKWALGSQMGLNTIVITLSIESNYALQSKNESKLSPSHAVWHIRQCRFRFHNPRPQVCWKQSRLQLGVSTLR